MLGAAMVGMANAIFGEREKAAMVMEAAGAPPGDDDLDVHLDPDDPSASTIVIRRQPG